MPSPNGGATDLRGGGGDDHNSLTTPMNSNALVNQIIVTLLQLLQEQILQSQQHQWVFLFLEIHHNAFIDHKKVQSGSPLWQQMHCPLYSMRRQMIHLATIHQ